MKTKELPSGVYPYLLMMGHICSDLNQGALPALLPFLISAHGLSYSAAAALITACNCISSVVQPLFGHLADKITAPAIMGIGVLLAGVALAGIGLVESYWAMFLLVMISGIGVALFHPEAGRTVNRISGKKKGASMGIFSVGGSIGFAVGPLIITLIIPRVGIAGTMFLAIPAVLMALLFFWQSGNLRQISARASGPAAGGQGAALKKDNWKGFSILTVMIFCRSIVMYGLIAYIPLYWVGVLAQTERTGSARLSILTAIGVVSTIAGGRLADRIGFNRIIKIGCTAMVPTLLLFSFNRALLPATLLLIPLGLIMNLSQSPAISLGQQFLPNHVGVASGVSIGLAITVGGISAPILGWIGDTRGLVEVMMALSGVALLSAVLAFLVPKPAPEVEPEEELAVLVREEAR